MHSNKTVRVFTVIYDTDQEGPAGDGTVIARFKKQDNASSFAAANTCYGRPATVQIDDAPAKLAQRWSYQG
jgi:hypothetical protein